MEYRVEARPDGIDPVGVRVVLAKSLILDAIGGIQDDHDVVVEECLQTEADAIFNPLRIVLEPDFRHAAFRFRDTLDFAQDALALGGDRLFEKLLFVVERNLVRPLGRRKHRNDNANDRHGDDHADRHDHAQAPAIPPGLTALLGDSRARRSQHVPTYRVFLDRTKLGTKACKSLASRA